MGQRFQTLLNKCNAVVKVYKMLKSVETRWGYNYNGVHNATYTGVSCKQSWLISYAIRSADFIDHERSDVKWCIGGGGKLPNKYARDRSIN